jgi:hypothetical protein
VKTIRLCGKDYRLSKELVQQRLLGVIPKRPDKYHVKVGRHDYPPKQVVAEALRVPLSSFTTMDAARVLARIGLVVSDSKQQSPAHSRTVSELLFEQYLKTNCDLDFDFEPDLGSNTKPDYRLHHPIGDILFEVKEFQPGPAGASEDDAIDPYAALREKIGAARKKFKNLERYCCNLVIFNRGKADVVTDTDYVFAAMLGNLAVRVPFDTGTGKFDSDQARTVFANAGKMIRNGTPENTTVSSIMVLEKLEVGRRRFDRCFQEKRRQLGRDLSIQEWGKLFQSAQGTERDCSLTQPSVIVHENPYARIPLPQELFRGPYDERYGTDDSGMIHRKYAGANLLELEALEQEALPLPLTPQSEIPNLEQEDQWLAANRQNYLGQWVALDGGRLLSHGLDGEQVHRDARLSGVELPLVLYLDPEDLPWGGW